MHSSDVLIVDLDAKGIRAELFQMTQRVHLPPGRREAFPVWDKEAQLQQQDYEDRIVRDVETANELALRLYIINEDLQAVPEDYEIVSIDKKYPKNVAERSSLLTDYHPKDIHIDPAYIFDTGGFSICKSFDYRTTFRMTDDTLPISRERIWNEDLLWWKVMDEFDQNPQYILHPLRELESIIEIQERMEHKEIVTKLRAAKAELEEIIYPNR